MKYKHFNRKTNQVKHLFDEFSQRIEKRTFYCFNCCKNNQIKFERIHDYCLKHGFILNHSKIHSIRTFLSNIITLSFDHGIHENHSNENKNRNNTNIDIQLTHINGLPNRTEKGLFLIIELGNIVEDVRYSLVSLLGKYVPSYDILHSEGYDLDKHIRISRGCILLDQLAIGLNHFLEQIPLNMKSIQTFQLGLLIHFPIKQNKLDHAEVLSWSKRFNCPDLLNQDFIKLFNQSINKFLFHYRINIIACIQESVASLISVAFENPNTYISIGFKDKFQLAFVEDAEYLNSNNIFQHIHMNSLYQTIFSFNLQDLNKNKSAKLHALFQTLLTSIDIHVMKNLCINYFDVLTCDLYVVEVIRLVLIDLSDKEHVFPHKLWSKSKLIHRNSLSFKFILYLLQRNYGKLKSYLTALGLKKVKRFHLICMEYVCHIIIRRSTQILSCLIVCLSDRYNEENLTIAMDSYLYRVCPIYQIYMNSDVEYLCKRWMTTFHFVNSTNKSYLGPVAVMGLKTTQKAIVNQDVNKDL